MVIPQSSWPRAVPTDRNTRNQWKHSCPSPRTADSESGPEDLYFYRALQESTEPTGELGHSVTMLLEDAQRRGAGSRRKGPEGMSPCIVISSDSRASTPSLPGWLPYLCPSSKCFHHIRYFANFLAGSQAGARISRAWRGDGRGNWRGGCPQDVYTAGFAHVVPMLRGPKSSTVLG